MPKRKKKPDSMGIDMRSASLLEIVEAGLEGKTMLCTIMVPDDVRTALGDTFGTEMHRRKLADMIVRALEQNRPGGDRYLVETVWEFKAKWPDMFPDYNGPTGRTDFTQKDARDAILEELEKYAKDPDPNKKFVGENAARLLGLRRDDGKEDTPVTEFGFVAGLAEVRRALRIMSEAPPEQLARIIVQGNASRDTRASESN